MPTEDEAGKSTFSLNYVLAPTLCLFAPFVPFLAVNEYLIFRPEVLGIFGLCLSIGLLAATFKAIGLPNAALIPVSAAVIFTVSFLANIDSTWLAVTVSIGIVALIVVLREHAASIVTFVALAHIASSLILPPPDVGRAAAGVLTLGHDNSETSNRANLPPVLHLVLDEFIGIHGIPIEVEGGEQIAAALLKHYRNLGFLIHTHAYSEYSNTVNSLTNLMRFESNIEDYALDGTSFTLDQNIYFTFLGSLGYQFNVFQTDYIDFCHVTGIVYSSCHTYKSDTARPIDVDALGAVDKAKFLVNSFLSTSEFTRNLRDKYERVREEYAPGVLPAWKKYNRSTGPLAIASSLQSLVAALANMQPGTVYFAHLMMPHYPYAWQEDCSIRPDPVNWLHRTPWGAQSNTEHERVMRYEQYFDQLACQEMKLDEVFESIRESGMWERAIIIIHGDHGARIVSNYANVGNREKLTPADYRDTYSAFFAHKGVSKDGGVDATPRSLQKILSGIFSIPNELDDRKIVYLGRGPKKTQKPESHGLIGFD
jgi:hypothetical protein